MQKNIDIQELHNQLGSVLSNVVDRHALYVLTNSSQPEAVLIPYEDFVRLQALQETEVLARFDSLVNRIKANSGNYTEAEVKSDVEGVKGNGK